MISKHDLVASSMNIRADNFGSSVGANGISPAITRKADSSHSTNSLGSKDSISLTTKEDDLSRSIWEHAAKLNEFTQNRAKQSIQDRQLVEQKESGKCGDAPQQEIS